ncbi:MAG: hypothetical protein WD552_02980 [Candidatus Paceibacterota bacterium]
MKSLLVLLTLLLLLATKSPTDLQAQESFSFEYITIGQGESPIASGLDIGVYVSRDEDILVGSFGSTKAYVLYQWNNFGVRGLSVSGSAGFFSGVPWAGPRLTYQPHKYLKLMVWSGVTAGDAVAGEMAPRVEFGFFQTDIQFPVSKYFTPGFSYLEFGGDIYLPYATGLVPISGTLNGLWSVTYDVTAETPMFFIGVSISLPW